MFGRVHASWDQIDLQTCWNRYNLRVVEPSTELVQGPSNHDVSSHANAREEHVNSQVAFPIPRISILTRKLPLRSIFFMQDVSNAVKHNIQLNRAGYYP
jgi:hypothetical protein